MQAILEEIEHRVGLARDWATIQAEVQGLEGPVKIREVRRVSVPPRGLGGFEPSPGLALSRDLHIHVTFVNDTLVGDTFYLLGEAVHFLLHFLQVC